MNQRQKLYSRFFILFTFILILVISLIVFKAQPSQKEIATPIIATDPDFVEAKGELISEFPEFPVYQGAILKGSAKSNRLEEADRGYRAIWETKDQVTPVMKWYILALTKSGWNVEEPNDPLAQGEQVAHITKDNLEGYIAVEDEGGETEIVVDLKFIQ